MHICARLWLGSAAVVLALGCGESAGGAGSASAAAKATTTATSGASAKPTATAEKKAANKTVKAADLKAAYEAAFNDMKTMKDPTDKKVAAFIAKVGEPAKTDGDKKIWYTVDGDKCQTAVLGADGAITESSVDKAECGL